MAWSEQAKDILVNMARPETFFKGQVTVLLVEHWGPSLLRLRLLRLLLLLRDLLSLLLLL